MMNNNNKIDEIKKVLERIRAEKYSAVPASIVEKIVDVQVNHNEDSEHSERDHHLAPCWYSSDGRCREWHLDQS